MDPVVTQKQALSINEQIELLAERGLDIGDTAAAAQVLYDSNYYRLMGYGRQFQIDPRNGDNRFEPGTTLAQLRGLMLLDAEFSRRLLHALGIIELTVRSRYALELAATGGPKAFYLRPASYVSSPTIDTHVVQLISTIEDELRRDKGRAVLHYAPSREDFSEVPVWVAIEVMSFGRISEMMTYLADNRPRDAVASSFGEPNKSFASTLHSLAVLRNRCAHHGQLWHRHLGIQTPTTGKQRHRAGVKFDYQGPFAAVLAIQRLLSHIQGGEDALHALNTFIAEVPAEYMNGIYNPKPRF